MEIRISHGDLQGALQARYATKQFDVTKKISQKDWETLVESLRLSPSSYGLQPWKFIAVQNPETRKALRAASWNQPQIEDASHIVVFTTLRKVDEAYVKKYIEKVAKDRSLTIEALKGYEDMMVNGIAKRDFDHLAWTQRQAYIPMGFLGLSAALLGIDTCMIEGLSPADYDKILGLEGTPYTTVAVVALGYRHTDDKTAQYVKSRFDLQDVVEIR